MPPDASGPLDRFLVRLPSAHEAEQAAEPCSSGEPAQHLQQQPSSPPGQPQQQCSTSGYAFDGPPGDCSFLSQQLAAASHSQRSCAQNLPRTLRQSQLLGSKPLSRAQYMVHEAKAQRMRALHDPGHTNGVRASVRYVGMSCSGQRCMTLTACAGIGTSRVAFSSGWPQIHAACDREEWCLDCLDDEAHISEDCSTSMQRHDRDSMPCVPLESAPDESMQCWTFSGTAVVARWSPTNDNQIAWCGARGHQAACAIINQGGPICHLNLGPDQTSSKAHDVQWTPNTTAQLACSSSRAVHLYDSRGGSKPHASITPAGGGAVGSLQYSPDGTFLIGATSLGQVQMWDVRKTSGGCRQLGATGVYQHALLKLFDMTQSRLMGAAMSDFISWQHVPIALVELLLDPCDPSRLAVVVEKRVAVINMTRGLLTHAAAVDACTTQRCHGITSCNISPASMPAGLVSSGDPCCSCWDSTGSVLYTRGDTVVQSNGEPWAVPALAAVDLSASSDADSPYPCSPDDGGKSAILSTLGSRGSDACHMSKLLEMRDRHTSLLPMPKLVTAVCRDAATGAMLVGFGGSGGVVYVN